jgi:hypothetical protein
VAKRDTVKSIQRNIVYQPPASDAIYEYTRAVCKELGETLDPEFDTLDMRSEMANFIKVVAEICAEQMNKNAKALDTEQP